MISAVENSKKHLEELEESITFAMTKVNVQKETLLCPYLPHNDGFLHHFSFKKLKRSKPTELLKMIKKHILEKEHPTLIPSKPKPYLKTKRVIDVKLKRSHIDQLVDILKQTGREDLIEAFSPHQSLRQTQKLLIESIRAKKIDTELWDTYVKLVQEKPEVMGS